MPSARTSRPSRTSLFSRARPRTALLSLYACVAVACQQFDHQEYLPDDDVPEEHALQSSKSFSATADARVEKNYPGSEFGTSSRLTVDGSPETHSYLKFDVAGLAGSVVSAKLRLYATDASSKGPSAFRTSNDWTETTLNWGNKPATSGTALGSVGRIYKSSYVEIDVTGAVTGNGTVSVALQPNSTDGADFYSRTGSRPPKLIVVTDSATSTDAGTVADAGSSTPDAGSCTPTTCASVGATCGSTFDGCGNTLNCGTCATGTTCSNNTCVTAGTKVTVAAVGDILGNWNVAKATSDLVAGSTEYQAALLLGDLVYPNGRYDCSDCNDFKNEYHPRWGRVNAIAKPVAGNHDYYGDRCDRYPDECLSSDANGAGFFRYFRENNVQVDMVDPFTGKRTEGYYSYDLGNWHLVALNTNWSTCTKVPCGEGSPQLEWLKRDLQANTRKCTLAYWHHPRFSSDSGHGNNTTVGPIWNALYAADADVVLNGHAHGYERFGKQNPSGSADSARGLRQFVVGTGGVGFYSYGTPKANSEFRQSTDHGILKLNLYASTQKDSSGKSYDYEWFFLSTRKDASGNPVVIDSGKDVCH